MKRKLILISIIVYVFIMLIVLNSTELRLLNVSIDEKKEFTKNMVVFSQVGTEFQESNCFYAVATSIIDDLKNKKYSVDDLRGKYPSNGVDSFEAYKILKEENVNASLYIGSKDSKIWLKLLNKYEYIILSANIGANEYRHALLLIDYKINNNDIYFKIFDPNDNRTISINFERLNQFIDNNKLIIGIKKGVNYEEKF